MTVYNAPDTIKARKWEGKPFSYKFKYFYANYTGPFVGLFIMFGVAPLYIAAQLYNIPNRPITYSKKYLGYYSVVRDDDPKIEKIKKIKEEGRELFPKY